MDKTTNTVGSLKTIKLLLEAVTTQKDGLSTISDPVEFEFIFGIGTAGLTPFEFALAGKRAGETITIQLTGNQLTETFQHLPIPLPALTEETAGIDIRLTINDITPAQDRDIVRAMAAAAECGEGCCGSH